MHGRKEKGISTESKRIFVTDHGSKNKTMPDILLDMEEIRHGVDLNKGDKPEVYAAFSILTAQTLNSGILETGSRAPLVSMFTAAS